MRAELKINRGGGDMTWWWLKELETLRQLLILKEESAQVPCYYFFFFSTAHFFFIFTGPSSQVRLIWKHSEQQRAARLLRDKERIHSHSNSCANEAWQWAAAAQSRAGRLLAACRLVCWFGWPYLLHRIPPTESSTLDYHSILQDCEPRQAAAML